MADQRFEEIVQSMSLVPTEMAHAIIDDLRVLDVLKMLVYDDPRVTAAISSHPGCRALFGVAPNTFRERKDLIQKYWNLAGRIGVNFNTSWYKSVIALNVSSVESEPFDSISNDLHARLWKYTKSQADVIDLNRFAVGSKRISHIKSTAPFAQLEEYCTAVHAAKVRFFEQASSQLRRACALLEKNPDLLKRTLDPEQERRPNITHLTSRMSFIADKISKSDMQKLVHTEHYRYIFYPLTPFDSSLAELLRMMEEFQITTGGVLLLNERGSSTNGQQHPPEIQRLVRVVIDGMAHYHTFWPKDPDRFKHCQIMNEDGDALRTGNTPWSEQPNLILDQPVEGPFFTPHKSGTNKQWFRPLEYAGREPFDAKEEEWVTSFVELYRYLEILSNKPSTVG
jgi:hypothetical protein